MTSAAIDLNMLEVFRAVATASSFTSAALRLGLDKARVSRVIAALELRLGSPLLIRSTRSMRLTPEGAALLQRIVGPLDHLKAATEVSGTTGHEGQVVVATTPEIARVFLPAALASFRLRFPKVTVVLRASPVLEDLSEVDVALRTGRRAPSNWVATRLRELEAGFFASPSYLERRGEPQQLADLDHHEGLWPIRPKGVRSFASGSVPPRSPAVACADFQTLAALALASAGIAVLPTFLVTAEVAAGRLLRVLPAYTFGSAPLILLTRGQAHLAPRARALRAHLVASVRESA